MAKTTTATEVNISVKKYRSNWEIFVSSKETENYAAGEFFSGQIFADFDGLDEEDSADYKEILEKLANLNTLEEVEKMMDEEAVNWNCTGQDLR